ncbi:hypothetical protein K435DRAFT_813196 [Dendrothele bispora CBS 962.96]|uniref:Uncharacterized protein n=1 Tax=Dendrothele bispora (strain CBS 962.96) TaxID=1314807 RepID=A0A4S8KMD9_DENBC|nr:hypothetical protein K435DRAFT_813196 [Dendrothele bispora CBS 962.96]
MPSNIPPAPYTFDRSQEQSIQAHFLNKPFFLHVFDRFLTASDDFPSERVLLVLALDVKLAIDKDELALPKILLGDDLTARIKATLVELWEKTVFVEALRSQKQEFVKEYQLGNVKLYQTEKGKLEAAGRFYDDFGENRHFNDRVTAVRQCYREMMRRIKNKKTATDEERDIIESHLDFIQNFDYSVRQNSADFPPWALEARDLCLNAAITAFPRSRDTRVRDARPHLDLRWLTLSRRKQGVWDPTVPFPSFNFENIPLYADEASAPSQNVAVAGSSTAAVSAFLRDTTPEHVDETDASSHVTEPVAPVDAGDSGPTVDPAPSTVQLPAAPSSPPTPPWSPSKRVRFSSPVPADAGIESSGNSAAIPAPADVPVPRLVIRIPARPRPAPETVSGQPEASTSTAGSSAPAIQAPTPIRRSMATLGPPSSEAGPSSAVAPPRATTTTGLTRAEAVASISTIEPVNCRPGRTLVPLIVEDLRETDVQFDFDAPGLEVNVDAFPANLCARFEAANICRHHQGGPDDFGPSSLLTAVGSRP